MLQSIFKTAQRGRAVQRSLQISPLSGGSYGGTNAGLRGMYGNAQEGLDYNKEAGLRWDNSAVYAILSFFCTCLNGTPWMTARIDSAGKPIPIPDHPLTAFLNNPNPWYDGTLLTSGQVFGEAARGNSYAYKHRNPRTGEVIALEYMPEGACFPYTWPGSGEWISEYRIATATGYFRVPPSDVLHMRWMTVNPFWPVLGLSPLESCLPDIVADKMAARHEAMIIKNSGVSSVSIAPLLAKDGDPQPLFGVDQREELRTQVEDNIGGDNRGRPMVWLEPVEVKQIGFDPKQILLTETRFMAESRITAVFPGVQPAVVGLAVGLEKSNNRASIEGAIEITIEMGVLPYMRHRGNQVTQDLIGKEFLAEKGEVVMYDESKIAMLKKQLFKMLGDLAKGPIFTLNEYRADAGMGSLQGGDVIINAGKVVPGVGEAKEVETTGKDEAIDASADAVDDGNGKVSGRPGDKVDAQGGDNGDGGEA